MIMVVFRCVFSVCVCVNCNHGGLRCVVSVCIMVIFRCVQCVCDHGGLQVYSVCM